MRIIEGLCMVRSLTRPCWLTLLALFLFLLSPWLRSLSLFLSLSDMFLCMFLLCLYVIFGLVGLIACVGILGTVFLHYWISGFSLLTSQWLYLYFYCTVRIQKSLHVCCCCVHVSDFFMFGLEGLTACVGILNIWVVFFFFFWH